MKEYTVNRKQFHFLLDKFLAEHRLKEKWLNTSKSFKRENTLRKEIYDKYGISEDDTYNEHLVKYKNKSLYDTGVSVSDNDEIIILQTCSNAKKYRNYNKKYLLVIGKKIFEEG